MTQHLPLIARQLAHLQLMREFLVYSTRRVQRILHGNGQSHTGIIRTLLTHQDIGQMDRYVRMVDDLKRAPDDNPMVGIILCAGKDTAVVRYSVLHGNGQLFASKYKLVLPSEDEIRAEPEKEQQWLAEQGTPQQ
ncbi:MAG: DUF1016 family protein [Sulfuritalea sp.]|nr:DUF1016 family protein [Sulfuritalea sp.]